MYCETCGVCERHARQGEGGCVRCPAPPPAGTGALRRPPRTRSGPSTPPPGRDRPVARRLRCVCCVGVVVWGSDHSATINPCHPPCPQACCDTPPHQVRAARPSRGEGIDGKAGDRPVSGTPPHHFPSTPTTHPATIARPYIPALPAKDGYGEHHHFHTLTPTRVPAGI